jgi:hypothetical protein
LDYSYFIDKITYRLANSNILYVKIFQAIALNNNLIDDKTNNKLLRFTDNAPWSYSDINFEELIEVSNKYDIVFPYGYELPINSGMISLVFKGYKKSGKTNRFFDDDDDLDDDLFSYKKKEDDDDFFDDGEDF